MKGNLFTANHDLAKSVFRLFNVRNSSRILLLLLVLAVKLQTIAQIPSDGLVAWFPFNGNANDESGNGNHGTINGGVVLTTDRFFNSNTAYLFDGSTNSFISVAMSNSLQIKHEITLSAWIYMEGGYYNPRIISNELSGYDAYFLSSFGISDVSRNIEGAIYNGATGLGAGFCCNGLGVDVPSKSWQFIAVTVDASGLSKMYINGQLSKTFQGTAINNTNYGPSLNIGRKSHPAFDAWGGVLDDILIYNRALSNLEILQLYNPNNATLTDIFLSSTSVIENLPIGSIIGTLTTSDAEGGSMTYALVSGSGDTDNSSFGIIGDKLITATAFNYEARTSYSIRIKVIDNGGLAFEKSFIISVQDVSNESIPTNGLIAWYPFNGNANDESGNGNHGTSNGANLTMDRFGNSNTAYNFDGYSEISVPHNEMLNLNSDLTISAWFLSEGPPTFRTNHTIATKRSSSEMNSYPFGLVINYQYGIDSDYKKPMFVSSNNGDYQLIQSSTDVSNNVWSQMTITISGNNIQEFIDGNLILSSTVDNSKRALNNANLLIGGGGRTDKPAEQFVGKIDDVGIWNRALSDSEVVQLYSAAKQVQFITFNAMTSKTYGDESFTLDAESNSGLTISYSSSNPDVATISDNNVSIKGAGTAIITASQEGNDLYGGAQPVQQTLTVNKASLTATAEDKNRNYGDPNPALTITYSGLKSNEQPSVIDELPTANTLAIPASNVGTYNIVPTGGADNNYSFTYANGTLKIAKTTLTATAQNQIREYGDENPAPTITYTGFKNNESLSVINEVPSANTTATSFSNAGTYSIEPSGGTDNNYSFNYINGSLTITKVTLTASAENNNKIYGDPNPPFTIIYNGFKNNETVSVIDTIPTATTSALSASNAGTYSIEPSGGSDNNYSFNYVNGTLTVIKSILTATADNQSHVYGDANPVLTITYTGLKNNEFSSVIDEAPTATTTATSFSNVGNYSIVVSGGTDNNYSFTNVDGTLTVTKAKLTSKADNKSRVYGEANPVLTITYSGFKNSETPSLLDTQPTATTPATPTSSVTTYPISVSGGMDNNYDFDYEDGTLTITKAAQTISFVKLSGVLESDVSFVLTGSASSGLEVSFATTDVDQISINENIVTIKAPGSVIITASQEGNDNYSSALPVNDTLCIFPKKPTISANGLGARNAVLASSASFGNQWYRNNSILPGETNSTYEIDGQGLYTVKVTVEGCSSGLSEMYAIIITDLPDNQQGVGIMLYPVPVKKELYITLSGVRENDVSILVVYDFAGNAVMQMSMRGGATVLDATQFSIGNYLLKVIHKTFSHTTRFIKN